MTLSEIANLRLTNQQIIPTSSKDVGAVVSSLCAVQAQDYLGSLWAIGLRLNSITEIEIQSAISKRQIVRTWPMRGTLHFVAPPDVRWMLALLTPRIIARSAGRQRQLELDSQAFAESRKRLVKALEGGKQLARDEIYATLNKAGISTKEQRGLHILWRLAQEGLLCFGAHAGKQPTFVLLEEWVPAARSLGRDESLAQLAWRYFAGHGPATFQDFVWWSGLTTVDARIGMDLAAPDLVKLQVNGIIYQMTPNETKSEGTARSVRLLPGFDEYMLGYKDRSAALAPSYANKILPGNNGMFMPTILVNGRVAGTWKRVFARKRVIVTAIPFAPLGRVQMHALAEAAERYGQFVGAPLELLIE
jgi:hypothetical protein